jgi:hypothetical protein
LARPGKGGGVLRGSPTTGLWPKLGSGRLRRRSAAVVGGGCHWSFCSGELPAGATQRAARAALAGSRAATGSVGLRRSWPEEAAPQRRTLARSTACVRGRTATAFIAGRTARLQALATKDRPLYSTVWRRPWQARSSGEQATDRWSCGGGTTRHALPGDGLAFLGDRREGDRRLVPRGGGTWPARTPRRRNAPRAAQGRQA